MPHMQSEPGSPPVVAENECGLLLPHPRLPFSFLLHPDIPGFRLAAPAEPKGCVRHRLDISSHRSCFLSTRSLIGCRKLLVLFLGKKDDDRERQARSASPTQTRMPQAPGSQSRVGTRFPPVQHPELGADIRNNGEKNEKQCCLQPLTWVGVGAGMEFPGRSILLPRESSGSRGWAESLWRQTSSSSVTHGFFFWDIGYCVHCSVWQQVLRGRAERRPLCVGQSKGMEPRAQHQPRGAGQHWAIPDWCECTQGWFSHHSYVLHQSQCSARQGPGTDRACGAPASRPRATALPGQQQQGWRYLRGQALAGFPFYGGKYPSLSSPP